MMKKTLPALICLLMILSLTLTMAGCGSDPDYPVTVGHTEIKEKPEGVVVLSDNLADVIFRLGYSTQIAGISDECTQATLTRYVDSVGKEEAPDVTAIEKTGAKYVLAEKPLSDSTVQSLAEIDVKVITMITPKTPEQLKALYEGLGKIMGGKVDGLKMGTNEYDKLIKDLDDTENSVDSKTVIKLFCYLYLDESGHLSSFSTATQEGMFLEYLAATNVAANFTNNKVDQNILKLSNPEYIFFDSEEVLDYIKSSDTLKELSALKKGNTYQVPVSSLQRQGNTMTETQKFMLSKMYPDLIKPETTGESLASRYGIELTEDMKYEVGSDHQDVKAIQQRLIDLGYLTLEDGDSPTTYYGNMTAEAVKNFQKSNNLTETGVADYETLTLLFMSTTLSTSGTTYIPGIIATEPASEPATESTKPANSGSGAITPDGYNITFNQSTSYKFDDTSEDIKAIQERLEDLGYLTFSDGDTYTTLYGPGTERAITQFQEDNGLDATGVADYETLKVLFDVE